MALLPEEDIIIEEVEEIEEEQTLSKLGKVFYLILKIIDMLLRMVSPLSVQNDKHSNSGYIGYC